ncbi:MAG TPA: DUF4149 domain-containing protein [Holophagaceae bacterium]|nr:DUF4149 domain-containing protein [Holophagaceae bacterium]
MTETSFRRLDAAVVALLLIWIGMGLGFGALTAPLLFKWLPTRDMAGSMAGRIVERLDWAAWLAFGLALLLGFGSRWLNEIDDAEPIGPLRLWTATALAALLFCFTSSFIVSPKLHELRSRIVVPIEDLAPENPDRKAYDKAHGLSRNLFFLRLLLAAGMALGASHLPRKAVDTSGAEA